MSNIPIRRGPKSREERSRGPRSLADHWIDQLAARGYDLERPWSEMLPRLPSRVVKILRGAQFENLRQLIYGLQRNDLVGELDGFGQGSLHAVQDCLVNLLARDAARISELDDLGDAQLVMDGLARALDGRRPDAPWSSVFDLDERIAEALTEADITTLGALLEAVEYDTLGEVPGIGSGSVSAIEDALDALAEPHREDDDEDDDALPERPVIVPPPKLLDEDPR